MGDPGSISQIAQGMRAGEKERWIIKPADRAGMEKGTGERTRFARQRFPFRRSNYAKPVVLASRHAPCLERGMYGQLSLQFAEWTHICKKQWRRKHLRQQKKKNARWCQRAFQHAFMLFRLGGPLAAHDDKTADPGQKQPACRRKRDRGRRDRRELEGIVRIRFEPDFVEETRIGHEHRSGAR